MLSKFRSTFLSFMLREAKSEFSWRKMRFLLRHSSTASVSRLDVKLCDTFRKFHDCEMKSQISLVSAPIRGMEAKEFSKDISSL